MEDKLHLLQTVLPTELLAPTLSSLAQALGYKGRSTLYRIVRGEASENSINHVYDRLEKVLYVGEDTLYDMSITIENTSRFISLIRAETDNFRKYSATDVVTAFVSYDYGLFSPTFRAEALDGLRRFEQTDPDAFFTMLAYFYVKSLHTDFYASGKSYKERCKAIIEPLGSVLMNKYPANGVAANCAFIYSRSMLNEEIPILWNCLGTLATMLKLYATPDMGKHVVKDMWLLAALPDRSYWKGDSDDSLILLSAVKFKISGSGYYEVFLINKDSIEIENIGTITFLSEQMLSYRNKRNGDMYMGMYELNSDDLTFTWGHGPVNPTEAGNRWSCVRLEHSQSLRTINKTITDDKLQSAVMKSEGFEQLGDAKVINVNLSRSDMEIILQNGVRYRIPYSVAPFLEYVSPNDEVVIAKRIEDGEIFIFWPQLMHCIPLWCLR